MSIFDNLIGNWIQIIDEKNNITIEDYEYSTGIIEGTTGNHCINCVASNKCWFKNQSGKKPSQFDFSSIKSIDYINNGLTPGLYHPNCHCKELMVTPNIDDIILMVPPGKIDWLFNDKYGWITSMGYDINTNFINLLLNKIKEAYFYGNYTIQLINNYGVKIKLNIDLPNGNKMKNSIYKLISSFTVFPNGKLKCNTLIGGWQK